MNRENIKLKTKRLILRTPKMSDFDFLKSMWEDGRVMKYVGFPDGLKQSDEKIKSWIEGWNSKDILRLVIVDKQTGEQIGETGYRTDEEYPFSSKLAAAPDIKLVPSFWGKGYGSEALKKIIEYIFTNTKLEIIQVTPNIKNQKVIGLYGKLGFSKKGKPRSCDLADKLVEYQYLELLKSDY